MSAEDQKHIERDLGVPITALIRSKAFRRLDILSKRNSDFATFGRMEKKIKRLRRLVEHIYFNVTQIKRYQPIIRNYFQLLNGCEVAGLTPLPSSSWKKTSDVANWLDIFKEIDASEGLEKRR